MGHHVHLYSVEKKLFICSCCRLAERLLAAFCCRWRSSRVDAGSTSVCSSSHLTHLEKHVNASLCKGTAGSSAISSSSSSSSCSGPQTVFTISSSVSTVCPCSCLSAVSQFCASASVTSKPAALNSSEKKNSLCSQLLLPYSIVFITLYIMHGPHANVQIIGVRIIEVRIKKVGLYIGPIPKAFLLTCPVQE